MEAVLVGRKIGMTRIFSQDGQAIAVSIVKVEPAEIIAVSNEEQNKRIKIAAVKAKKINKPLAGQLKGQTKEQYRLIKEFIVSGNYQSGDKLTASSFQTGDSVSVVGVSKGKGFAGVIKRHGFSRGPESHGSDHHRKPGSIGSMFPQHVLAGQKMPGRLGGDQITVKNLKIIEIDETENLVLVSGAVPGPNRSLIYLYK